MAVNLYLSQGDGNTTGYLDLLDATKHKLRGDLWMPPAPMGARTRTVTVPLTIKGATADVMWANYQAIETKLLQARTAAGPMGTGLGVTLGVQLDTTLMVYFDVQNGALTYERSNTNNLWLFATLTLTCLPYARGTSYDTTVTATLTNGDAATTYVEDIPGDVPALVRARFTDVSTTSTYINRLRVGTFSLPADEGADDFDPVLDAAAVSPGSSGAEAGTIGGTRIRLTNLSSAWQNVASVTGATPTNRNNGLYDVWARVRSAAAPPGVPTNLAYTTSSAGTLTGGNYQVRVVTVDGSGNLSLPSSTITEYLNPAGSQDRIALTWTAGSGASDHRVYWKRDTNAWLYKATGSASGAYNLDNETSATTGDPPSESTIGTTQARAVIGLSSATTLYEQPSVSLALENSLWELVHLGTFPLPPIPTQDAGTPLNWTVRVQAKHDNSTATFDVDAVYVFPSPSEYASQVVSEVEGLALATLRRHMIETRRDGRTFGWLANTSTGAEAGQLSVLGSLYIGPGDALVWASAEKASGVHDVTDSKFTILLSIVPRYLLIRGT